jgi:inhibitor of KinA
MLEFEGHYDSKLILDSLSLSGGGMNSAPTGELLEIPVCYETPFARDLNSVAEVLGLKPQEIVDRHAERIYDVWMLGFMPGYPYMGSLNEKIQLPRKSTPDFSVSAGSVAIAEEFVGVYPFDSPGGWHIIGITPLKVVDYSRSVPFLFQYGMKVKFYPISTDEFHRLK